MEAWTRPFKATGAPSCFTDRELAFEDLHDFQALFAGG